MVARLSAFVIWALVAATAVFWGLRLFASAPAAPSYTVAVGDAAAVRADLSRVLGSAPVAAASATISPEASSRFKLLGIMAPKGQPGAPAVPQRQGNGVALIAVDGKPPKAYVVGARVDDELVLQSVSLRTAAIGPAQGAASIKLELPPPTAAATGTLPSPGAVGAMTNSPAPVNQPPVLTPLVPPQPLPSRPGVAVQPPPAVAPQPAPPPMPQVDANNPQVPMVVPPPARDPNAPTK
ncbi:MAG TPA: hypothetical protein VJO99_08900 [Burkholderiaceae bacterium]|nr:hypothetical protein [Burkholderiaceae bacterium]